MQFVWIFQSGQASTEEDFSLVMCTCTENHFSVVGATGFSLSHNHFGFKTTTILYRLVAIEYLL